MPRRWDGDNSSLKNELWQFCSSWACFFNVILAYFVTFLKAELKEFTSTLKFTRSLRVPLSVLSLWGDQFLLLILWLWVRPFLHNTFIFPYENCLEGHKRSSYSTCLNIFGPPSRFSWRLKFGHIWGIFETKELKIQILKFEDLKTVLFCHIIPQICDA